MKPDKKHLFAALFILLLWGCSHPAPIPRDGSYFAFGDPKRVARLVANDLIGERVSLSDTTKVLVSRTMRSDLFDRAYTSNRYTVLFLPSGNAFLPDADSTYRIRFRYEGLPGLVDKLEFRRLNVSPFYFTDVRFNGKPIPRINSDEPDKNSYLYVLQ